MSANMELVTSHQGTPHITTDQVKDLLAGFSGDVSGIKIFPQLDGGLTPTITDILEVTVATGQGLAGGYHFQLLDNYVWAIDPDPVGYSRIDILFLVIYEDSLTNVQSVDLVYEKGAAYQNGTTGTEPSAPTGTNVKDTFPFLRVDMTDAAVVTVTAYGTTYLSNKALSDTFSNLVTQLETDVGGTVTQVNTNTQALNGLRFGKDNNGNYGYYKVGADTVTPFRNPKGNAVAAEVLAGKTFANANSDELTGIMTNRGAWYGTGTPTGNNEVTVTIPQGYHNGSGKVTCKGQSSYSAGNTAGIATGHADTKNLTIGSVTLNYSGGSGTITVTVGGGSKTYNVGAMGMGTESITAKVGYNNGVTNGAII